MGAAVGVALPVGTVRIGISGWTYGPWRGKFYPAKLPHSKELTYAARIFPSIEINGTFYSLQKPQSFARWAEAVPDDFVFSVKAPRYITHILRLRGVRVPCANFMASGLLRLGSKLGPILRQLPPTLRFDQKLLEAFLKLLPHDSKEAASIARRHNKVVSRRSWLKTDAIRPLRHCIEIRHKSFESPNFIELLRQHDVGLVCADSVEWPQLLDVTSDFVYCRLHGSQELYASGYDGPALDVWATRVAKWARGQEPQDAARVVAKRGPSANSRDVFVYFDNDAKCRAPVDAKGLIARVRQLAGAKAVPGNLQPET